MNDGKSISDCWTDTQIWGKLGKALIPCPKIDVKFIILNSTTLSPILAYHGYTKFFGTNKRIGNCWEDWIQIFPRLRKKARRDTFRYCIQTDGIYASVMEAKKYDEFAIKKKNKKKNVRRDFFLILLS